MTYKEIQCDLFELDLNEYWFVQCISWEQVRDLIHEVFDDTDIDITVCYQE